MLVLLDAGVLGDVINPSSKSVSVQRHVTWATDWLERGGALYISGIADYEVRRSLLLKSSDPFVQRLDEMRLHKLGELREGLEFFDIAQDDLDRAAGIWAKRRDTGRQTGPDDRVDWDSVLCAQAERLSNERRDDVVVATTNVKHLAGWVDARLPENIT